MCTSTHHAFRCFARHCFPQGNKPVIRLHVYLQGADKSLANKLLMLCADMHAKNGDETKAIEMLEKLVVGGNKVGTHAVDA